MFRWRTLSTAVCWSALGYLATISIVQADDKPATNQPEILTTADGLRFGIWPARPRQPAPTLFILSGTIEDALGTPTYRQSGTALAAQGYLCVSVDLPCHGEDAKPNEAGLTGWRVRCNRGEDLVADVTGRLRKVLDYLIDQKLTDPARVAAAGTSRGGFIALHFAAADPRVRCAVGFAPLTDLAALSEFRGAEENPLVKRFVLENQAESLADRAVWIVIGDRDVRVDTDRVIQFARAVTRAALAKQLSPRVDLHVPANPKGHTTPAGAANQAALWIDRQLRKRAPPASENW